MSQAVTPLPKDPEVGDLIDDRYLLNREIAQGGGGAVFQAEHQFTKRRVALKLLLRQHLKHAEHRERLLQEAAALTVARHRNVVEVLDAGLQDVGGPYLVMELLEGRALDGLIASRRQLRPEQAVWAVQQMAAAVARMHRLGLVHRDVKPGNAFVAFTESGEEVIKLFDYGTTNLSEATDSQAAQSGALMGTPEYMPPEQLLGSNEPDPRIDVYSLGITLYECLSGTVPFEGSFGEVLMKVHQSDAAPLREKGVAVSDKLEQIVRRCIAKEPGRRFPDAGRVWEALMEVSTELPPVEESLLGVKARAESAAPGVAQRRFARVPYVTPIKAVGTDGVTFTGRSQDLSAGGLLALFPLSCQPELLTHAEFALPSSGKVVRVAVKGRWVRSARVSAAVGLEFIQLPDALHEDIQTYVMTMINK